MLSRAQAAGAGVARRRQTTNLLIHRELQNCAILGVFAGEGAPIGKYAKMGEAFVRIFSHGRGMGTAHAPAETGSRAIGDTAVTKGGSPMARQY